MIHTCVLCGEVVSLKRAVMIENRGLAHTKCYNIALAKAAGAKEARALASEQHPWVCEGRGECTAPPPSKEEDDGPEEETL